MYIPYNKHMYRFIYRNIKKCTRIDELNVGSTMCHLLLDVSKHLE